MKVIFALISGMLFGLGLAVSGMTDRQKVLNFLDLFGAWDPSLAFVMGAALLVSVPAYFFILKRAKPTCDTQFHTPTTCVIDLPLILGGIFFGVGWGLYGYCPGPALTSLIYGQQSSVMFVLAMLAGMVLATIKKPR